MLDRYEFIFIVGSGRCGSTALALTLASLPGIASLPELKYFSNALSSRKHFEPYVSEEAIMRFFTHALEKVLNFNGELRARENEIVQRFTTILAKSTLVGSLPGDIYRAVFLFLVAHGLDIL